MRRTTIQSLGLAAFSGSCSRARAAQWGFSCLVPGFTSWLHTTSSTSEDTTLKHHLRQLYKLVHPDLFNDKPVAGEANGRSLQLLQEYLDQSKRGGELGRTAGVPFTFEFYLREQKSIPSDRRNEGSGQLKHVTVSLPPPGRTERFGQQLARSTQLGLAKLLTACGLNISTVDGYLHGVNDPAEGTLREFVPAAAELARQRALAQTAPHAQIGMMRTALRMTRQASVGFGPGLRQSGAGEQLAQIQKLAEALDKVKHLDLGGVHLMIGRDCEACIDAWGNLWLDAQGTALAWAGVLLEARLQDCRLAQARAKQLSRLETAVATAIGVAMIYAAPSVGLQSEYTDLLHALAHVGEQHGPIEGPAKQFLPVCVGSAAPGGDLSSFAADRIAGLMRVPVNSDAHGVYRYLQVEGPALVSHIQRSREMDEEAESMRGLTERRLRLRRLMRDPALSHKHFRAACLRLLHGSVSLVQLFEGLSVRVSFANQVAPNGDVIDIAWDFEV